MERSNMQIGLQYNKAIIKQGYISLPDQIRPDQAQYEAGNTDFNTSKNANITWYLDSSASHHFMPHTQAISTPQTYDGPR